MFYLTPLFPSRSLHRCRRLLGFFLLFFGFCLRADWSLIDDFESYEVGTYVGFDSPELPGLIYPGISFGGDGQMDILSGIRGTGGDKAAWFWYGGGVLNQDFWHQIPLNDDIRLNEMSTVFFRVWQETLDVHWYAGLSRVAAGSGDDSWPPPWPQLAAILRYSPDRNEVLEAREGDTYARSLRPEKIRKKEWYAYWIVADNGFLNDQQTGTYTVYQKGPEDAYPVRLQWLSPDGSVASQLRYRNTDQETFKALVLIQQAFSVDRWLIDDIYQAEGACLSDPTTGEPCRTWHAYPVIGDDADTLGWLDWLYVAEDSWAWSYSLESWLYVPGAPEARGGWVFVAR